MNYGRLLTAAKLLYAHAANGLPAGTNAPGWLTDCAKDIEQADLASPSPSPVSAPSPAGGANPAAMTERLIDAAIYNEQASGAYTDGARRELNEARAAIERALSARPHGAVMDELDHAYRLEQETPEGGAVKGAAR